MTEKPKITDAEFEVIDPGPPPRQEPRPSLAEEYAASNIWGKIAGWTFLAVFIPLAYLFLRWIHDLIY